MREGGDRTLFFKHEAFHNIVVIKEANRDPLHTPIGHPLLTKLYFPYNAEDIYEGGRSIFLHDPKLLVVLNELLGMQGTRVPLDELSNDVKMLEAFDTLPSLDAFLMRDALELDGFSPNPAYLEVADEERAAICEFIREKFAPLVCAALEDPSTQSRKVGYFVDKLWEAKDLVALEPLIKACRFPKSKALSISTARKGVYYYSFEYERAKPRIDALGAWLEDIVMPRAIAVDTAHLSFLKKSAADQVARHVAALDGIVEEYDGIYARFPVDPEATATFINFLRRAREIYWHMGEALSALNHAVNCWAITTANFAGRKLPPEQLQYALACLARVLAGARRVDRSGAVGRTVA